MNAIARVLFAASVGAVFAFPGASAWFFEWHASPENPIAWGFWLMVALGALGGALWQWSSCRTSSRRYLTVAGGVLVFWSYPALAIYAAGSFAAYS